MMDVAFIISTGRTGTLFLAEFLNRIEGVTACHEADSALEEIGNGLASGRLTLDRAIEAVNVRVPRLSLDPAAFYVEVDNRLWSMVPALRAVFPNCKIVRIVRDGRDVVRSGMSRGWYDEDDPVARMTALEFDDDPWAERWPDLTRLQKIAWWWAKKDSTLWESLRVSEFSQCANIRYEDIFDIDLLYAGMFRLLDFLNLRHAYGHIATTRMQTRVNATTAHSFPHWTEWSSEQQDQFDEVAGEYLDRLCYR